MNLSAEMLGLEAVTGLPVEEDSFTGDEMEYIVFNYADERGALFADDEMRVEQASMIVNVTLKKSTNYHGIKKAIRDYLYQKEAFGISSSSFTERLDDGEEVRHLIFECMFTKEA